MTKKRKQENLPESLPPKVPVTKEERSRRLNRAVNELLDLIDQPTRQALLRFLAVSVPSLSEFSKEDQQIDLQVEIRTVFDLRSVSNEELLCELARRLGVNFPDLSAEPDQEE